MSCTHTNKNCGCSDKALTTPPPCEPSNCQGEECAELYCMECVAYCQDSFEFNIQGTTFTIERGERLMTTIQNLLTFLNDPACLGKVATEVGSIAVTDSSITISWKPGNDLYVVKWSSTEGSGTSPTQQSTVTQYTIENLVSDTEYTIYVTNETETCDSVTIKVKTN